MTILYYKRRTVHSIFQVRVCRNNTKCADKTGFPRSGHSLTLCNNHTNNDYCSEIIRIAYVLNTWLIQSYTGSRGQFSDD